MSQEPKWSPYSSETGVMAEFDWTGFYVEDALPTGIYGIKKKNFCSREVFTTSFFVKGQLYTFNLIYIFKNSLNIVTSIFQPVLSKW